MRSLNNDNDIDDVLKSDENFKLSIKVWSYFYE